MVSETDLTVEQEPFIPYADVDEAPKDLLRMVAAYVERMGFLPNALKIYAHRPHIFKQIIRINNTVMRHPDNVVPEEFKYRMAFIISRNHGCRYCCAHHANTMKKKFGFTEEELDDILHLRNPRDEREAVAWEYAHAASQGPEHVTDEMRKELAAHFTPEEVVEIACTLGFWAFYNRVHSTLAVPIEDHLLPEQGWVDVTAED